ncbi:pullulanase [Salisediminibacterium beveridgei]|uniref:pullulanase n=1 Tax=Salisediminibacterium beveridgei TaxID=632773 RepID=A0A1D7QS33_9BACI|nr:pullulanase [Salisediminibacterium beveridgei]AOM81793.1 Pullulanase [Salisediminibacterium beveridgei]
MTGKKMFWMIRSMIAVMVLGVLGVFAPGTLPALAEEDVPGDHLRVHFQAEEDTYGSLGLWIWDDVADPSNDWPEDALAFEDAKTGEYGAYLDVPLLEDAQQVGFLIVDRESGDQTGDMGFDQFDEYDEVFLREGDETVYTSPDFTLEIGLERAELLDEEMMELGFTATSGMTQQEILEELHVTNADGDDVELRASSIMEDERTVRVLGDFDLEQGPFVATYEEHELEVRLGWRLKDEQYAYDGDLGAALHDDGSAELKLWSPSAEAVSVILYHRDDQYEVVADDLSMEQGENGVWSVTLDEENTDVADLEGYYYHYEITHDGRSTLALDPYAPSMATWDSSDEDNNYIGKAAIVDPATIGPELDYAEIDGFEKREDAIIYELHVRDFTSDPAIEEELDSTFGTFAAFTERLDYLEELGVTHVQLLPVMSYFFSNEYERTERMMDYSSTQNNYNWGYDPHSYFSLTGMYSQNPDDPAKRIEEFKLLVDAIHERGMGVILDVVYNHTARVHIFEDLEPNYYHFMDADGTPRVSFGGGRLGTTHEMARRILVDSIMHWVEEYKVDGFRFDMMGDHDAESIQIAYDKAKEANPNLVMIGEGWRTFVGDEGHGDVQPADQDWMRDTESVGSFSDDFRNELKSGFGSEGEPRFITGGARDIQRIYGNLTADPDNFMASNPGDVVPYIAAHDNLTLHDVIAQSIQKDPKDHAEEIHERIRLGNLMVLTAQGTAFLHGGQEYGRTKQFRHEDFVDEVAEDDAPYKSTFMTDQDGNPFDYPYFIHDSYDATDAVNLFDWSKVTDEENHPENVTTKNFTQGMIHLRRSTDAFTHGTLDEVSEHVSLLEVPEVADEDLAIAYRAENGAGTEVYYVFLNADDEARTFTAGRDLSGAEVLVDKNQAGVEAIAEPNGVSATSEAVTLEPLTATVLKTDGTEQVSAAGTEGEVSDGDAAGSGIPWWLIGLVTAGIAVIGYVMEKKYRK